jgi:hypothetical protein
VSAPGTIFRCRACGAPIIFLRTKRKLSIPIDAATVDAGDVDYDASKHKAHFSSCTEPDTFRKRSIKKGELK